MTIRIISTAVLFSAAALSAASDYKGYKDPALFTRLPNYYLVDSGSFVEKQFDAYKFVVKAGTGSTTRSIEGHFTEYDYRFDHSAGACASPVQIMRNYQAAAKRIGGEVLFDSEQRTTLWIARNGQETWAEVIEFNGGNDYRLRIVEQQAMAQDVVANVSWQLGLSGHLDV